MLKSEGWLVEIETSDGFLDSIIIIPPWGESLTKQYYSPLVADATFTEDKLTFYTLRIIDGEKNSHTVVLVIRAMEDSKGYNIMFEFARKQIQDGSTVTLISDMGKPIQKAFKTVFPNNSAHMYCCFHIWELILRKFYQKPTASLKEYFFKAAYGKLNVDLFINMFSQWEVNHYIDLRITDYICNLLPHWCATNTNKCHRRGYITSQSAEIGFSAMKRKGNDSVTILDTSIKCITKGYNKGFSRHYESNQFLTGAAIEIINELKSEILFPNPNRPFHSIEKKTGRCCCNFYQDSGIPFVEEISLCLAKNIPVQLYFHH